MNSINRYHLFFLYPLIVLIEGLAVEPYFSVAAADDTYPILQILFLLIIICMPSDKLRINSVILIVFFVFLLIISILNSLTITSDFRHIYYYLLLILCVFFVVFTKNKSLYTSIKMLMYGYLLACFIIYLVRINTYGFNPFILRSGINIFGGYSLIVFYLLYLLIEFYYGMYVVKKSSLEVFITLKKHISLIFFLSLVYMNRFFLVILLFPFIVVIFQHLVYSKLYLKLFPIIIIIIFYYIFQDSILFLSENLFVRFDPILQGNFDIETLSSDRNELWIMTLQYISNDFSGSGIGNFDSVFNLGYKSPHNYYLNNLFEFGIVFGIILNLITFIYIFDALKFLKAKVCFSTLVFLLLSFSLVLGLYFTGGRLIQTTGYISPLFFLGFISYLKLRFAPSI